MKGVLENFRNELQDELIENILNFWIKNAVDIKNGGFYGRITNSSAIVYDAPKGVVLNTRILYSFSEAYRITGNRTYLSFAERAFKYISVNFIDHQYGGCYWLLDAKGKPINDKKQIYAQAFMIYGLAAYYDAKKDTDALQMAIDIFHEIERHAADVQKDGYLEACSRNWKARPDFRVSNKDMNSAKTMNTHLHIMEAYTRLFAVWRDPDLGEKLKSLVLIHTRRIYNKNTSHLQLFFDESWNPQSKTVSFGHDIEASWLLPEAIKYLDDALLKNEVKEVSLGLVHSAFNEGIAHDGSLLYEAEDKQITDSNRHWWPQAEAMVGFMNAWEITNESKFLEASFHVWEFVKTHLRQPSGEWWWRVDENYIPAPDEDLAGPWKGPYHNGRACMEIMKRIQRK